MTMPRYPHQHPSYFFPDIWCLQASCCRQDGSRCPKSLELGAAPVKYVCYLNSKLNTYFTVMLKL